MRVKIGKITLAIIKPDAVENGYIGSILFHIVRAGFRIKALKMTKISKKSAKKFYEEHKKSLFFESLVDFMSSGPIVLVLLEKENAVKDFRTLIGDKNPIKAKKGTIRKLYASSLERNAIHGSDSDKKAFKECRFYFSNREIFFD
ncbi:MAG: nucleoside-diphosphate kinase [Flavobacteriales bacterium]|jgi:nucleoside-diphosphate kinase|uniref:nucleoside-diphosphate kinase n=1 Tax=Blattabacterium sp. (Mastotermes darwiniensis) TaxID=39768 RepID=UPI000231DDB9|nr:nucleoside-diphosphate kinase [Blattabacterium sp. (Mastotermes darwiniensis)]AER40493.1 Nucleoside-diphosphate kinase [Blattabacterium sp. (Mastotermes darwiniensis) str. MADAR]MDR1804992.1 nucleoside-diphosphate kinase [Flavobacteriales bacterium]